MNERSKIQATEREREREGRNFSESRSRNVSSPQPRSFLFISRGSGGQVEFIQRNCVRCFLVTFIEKICFGQRVAEQHQKKYRDRFSTDIAGKISEVARNFPSSALGRTFTASPRNTIVLCFIAHDAGRDIFSRLPTWQAGRLAEL